jgi:hypothetical protein
MWYCICHCTYNPTVSHINNYWVCILIFYVQKSTLCAIYATEHLIVNYIGANNPNHIES